MYPLGQHVFIRSSRRGETGKDFTENPEGNVDHIRRNLGERQIQVFFWDGGVASARGITDQHTLLYLFFGGFPGSMFPSGRAGKKNETKERKERRKNSRAGLLRLATLPILSYSIPPRFLNPSPLAPRPSTPPSLPGPVVMSCHKSRANKHHIITDNTLLARAMQHQAEPAMVNGEEGSSCIWMGCFVTFYHSPARAIPPM